MTLSDGFSFDKSALPLISCGSRAIWWLSIMWQYDSMELESFLVAAITGSSSVDSELTASPAIMIQNQCAAQFMCFSSFFVLKKHEDR